MEIRRSDSPRVVWLIACLAPIVFGGCGVGAYEERLAKKQADLVYLEQFLPVEKTPTDIPNSPISLRLPPGVKDLSYTEQSPDPDSGTGTIDPSKLQPPLVHLPGMRVVYERRLPITTADGQGRMLPYDLYIAYDKPELLAEDPAAAADPAAAKKPAEGDDAPKLADALLAELAANIDAASLADQKLAWETYEAPTPDPKTKAKLAWKRIRLKLPQNYGVAASIQQPEPTMGAFQLYLYESDDRRVMALWRVPDALADQVPVDTLAETMAGTLLIR